MANRRLKRPKGGFTAAGIREVEFARNRIGKTRINELDWLLSFAYVDLDNMSDGRRNDLAWEVAAFSFNKEKHLDMLKLGVYVDNLSGQLHFPDEDVRFLQREIKKGFVSLFSKGDWEYVTAAIRERLKMGQPPRREELTSGFPSKYRRRIEYAFNLVKAEQDRLRICDNPRCNTPFVTRKKDRGRFCSPGCNAYTRISLTRIRERLESRPQFSKLKMLDQIKELRAAEKKWREAKTAVPR
jgi:hypothetical protein